MKIKRKIYPYNPKLKLLARKLRNNSTYAEVLLWNQLKNKKLNGYDFHRQKPILNYILDFFCHELYLAIEVDGITHDTENQQVKDKVRQSEIEALGITFLRFDDMDIKTQMDGVISEILNYVEIFEKSGRD
jgi:very-short-patch-repair endonuclease